jgi:hypothetical protein
VTLHRQGVPLAEGLVDATVRAVDGTWFGLAFVPRRRAR